MFDFSNPETMWLNTTNIVLGLVTLACLTVFFTVLVKEVLERARSRALVPHLDDHAFEYHDLGMTMADGGERMDERELPGSGEHPENENGSAKKA